MRLSKIALTSAVAILAAGLAPGVAAVDASASPSSAAILTPTAADRIVQHTVSPLVKLATKTGQLAATTKLHLVLPLDLPNKAAMDAAVSAEYDPHSSAFHQFLKPKQFGEEFGANSGDITLVTAALQKLGFTVSSPTAGHLYLDATGSVATAERAFKVDIENFKLPSGQSFYSNLQNLELPSSLAGLVTGVVGLSTASAPRSQLEYPGKTVVAADRAAAITEAGPVGIDGGTTPCAAAIAGAGYTAPQLATAYDFNGLYKKGLLGQGMRAALVEFDDYHDSNVAGVESCYGLSTPVKRQIVDGGTGGAPAEGEGEDMADISTMLEMLPKLKQLDVYVAPVTSSGEIDLYGSFAARDQDPVLSSSWGNCEELNSAADNSIYEAVTEEAAAQGQQILDAAGDSGAVDCSYAPAPVGYSVTAEEESSVPWVTGVGGTDLGLNTANGTSLTRDEDTWNSGSSALGGGAGGGGVSVQYAMPAWQHALKSARTAPGHTGANCGAVRGQLCREVPDLSADADDLAGVQGTGMQFTGDVGSVGYSIYCDTPNCSLADAGTGLPVPTAPGGVGGWEPVGGTSLATPLTASAVVLWDQEAKAAHLAGVGLINPALYRIAANKTKYANDFHDITTDNNDDQYGCSASACNPKHLYNATPGYDMASGLGSIDAVNLGADVVKQATHINIDPSTVHVYGYIKGVHTTYPIVVSSGYRHLKYTTSKSAHWLHVKRGKSTGSLKWYVSPKGLKSGTRRGKITVHSHGQKASVTVIYQVSKKAKFGLPKKPLVFKERIVNTDDDTTASVCNDNLYNDEFFDGTNFSSGTPVDKSTKRILKIRNAGPKGSVLHWEAFPDSAASAWLGTDLAFGKPAKTPARATVPTGGTLKAGKSFKLHLASFGDGNAFSGYPKMNQGTYLGFIRVTDLADPKMHQLVKAKLILGNGKHTPTIKPGKKSYSVSVKKGGSTAMTVKLSDASKACGFSYSLTSRASYVVPNADDYSGVVAGSGPAAATGTDTGDGAGEIQLAISAKNLKVGKHKVILTVQSQNATPNPKQIPLYVNVTK